MTIILIGLQGPQDFQALLAILKGLAEVLEEPEDLTWDMVVPSERAD